MPMVDTTLLAYPLPPGIDCWPPTEDELPYEDGWVSESNVHQGNPTLLKMTLHHRLAGVQEAFIGVNMFVYYSPDQVKTNDFLGPDFFVALDRPVDRHKSYVMWEQGGRPPDVVIEMLSDSTATNDRGKKLRLYQDRLRVSEYYLYDPWTSELTGFRLTAGVYQPIAEEPDGSMVCQRLGLKLVRWEGVYEGLLNVWLRWATLDGVLLPTPEEDALRLVEEQRLVAEQERVIAEQAQLVAEQERAIAEQERAIAEQARHAAEQAQQAAEDGRRRAADLEARLQRYQQQFGNLPE